MLPPASWSKSCMLVLTLSVVEVVVWVCQSLAADLGPINDGEVGSLLKENAERSSCCGVSLSMSFGSVIHRCCARAVQSAGTALPVEA